MVDMTDDEFDEAVADALDAVPPELTRLMDNVVVLVEPEPQLDNLENLRESGESGESGEHGEHGDLLGLYEGIPLTERDLGWGGAVLPDRISIFRGPILRHCADRDEVVREVAVTVIHEIAHHFGIDDARLHQLGWA